MRGRGTLEKETRKEGAQGLWGGGGTLEKERRRQGQLGEIRPRHGSGRGSKLDPGVGDEGGALRASGAQGQSRREQGRGARRLGSGTVPARAGKRRAAWEAGTVPARA